MSPVKHTMTTKKEQPVCVAPKGMKRMHPILVSLTLSFTSVHDKRFPGTRLLGHWLADQGVSGLLRACEQRQAGGQQRPLTHKRKGQQRQAAQQHVPAGGHDGIHAPRHPWHHHLTPAACSQADKLQ